MCHTIKRSCIASVFLIKDFVCQSSRCRCGHGCVNSVMSSGFHCYNVVFVVVVVVVVVY